MSFLKIINYHFTSYLITISAILMLCCSSFVVHAAKAPAIQLANIYHQDVNINDYLISEKLDGVRAYWNGQDLISRQGIIFAAPKWFIANFPKNALEGELWIARNQFDLTSGIVRQKQANNDKWQQIRFMIFDMPKHKGNFAQRLQEMKRLVNKANSPYLQFIEQYNVSNHQDLMHQLDDIIQKGGEGLMLHKADSLYQAKRNDDILKLKKFQDAEAIVIAHAAGKGKYKGMLGSILVENEEKIQFRIGTGFSDKQRRNPPKIGSIITYKYWGKTKNNIPRFASFMRIRYEK
jgi:DNA ligase-1